MRWKSRHAIGKQLQANRIEVVLPDGTTRYRTVDLSEVKQVRMPPAMQLIAHSSARHDSDGRFVAFLLHSTRVERKGSVVFRSLAQLGPPGPS